MKSLLTISTLLYLLLFAPHVLAAQSVEVPAIAYSGLIAGDEGRTRLILDFDRKVSVRLRFSDEPARMVIELPPTAFRLGNQLDASKSPFVAKIAYDNGSVRSSRVILDLDRPIKIARQSVEAIGTTGRRRLILDLTASTEREFAALARSAPIETPRLQRIAPREGGGKLPLIVLDPGHGGRDGGARGAGRTSEKDVTLAFAKALKRHLLETGAFRVALTREEDKFVRLSRRLAFAREAEASLLISIHADSLRLSRIRGATVYTLSKQASDELSAGLAREQNRVDLRDGLGMTELDGGAADILFDLMQRETDQRSAHVADHMVTALSSATRLIGNPNRSADFFVLRSPDVPSILLELGYLSNKDDEKLLASSDWQEKVAVAIANGLSRTFERLPSSAMR